MIRFLLTLALVATSSSAFAQAPPGKVLFVNIDGNYDADGVNAFNQLAAYVGAEDATYFNLSSNGALATHLQSNTYQQIWVYDLSYTHTDPYPLDWAAIDAWYDAHPTQHIICDGRFLSSFWNSRAPTEGRKVVENFFYNLAVRGGGLVLATDHDVFFNQGMSQLTDALGLNRFVGNFNGTFPLDPNHPVSKVPNVITSLSNDSSTGQAPFGQQPNGKVLHTFGYHSGNTSTPGISSTIDGSLGVRVTLDGPTDGAVFCNGGNVTFSSTPSQGQAPFTFTWTSNRNGALGNTEDIVVNVGNLSPGLHTITVTVTDSQSRVDNDTIQITIGGSSCAQTCGGGTEVCIDPHQDGTLFTIGLVGPSGPAYAICRVVPFGFGTNPVAPRHLDCEDADGNGTVDVFTPAQIVQRFGAGYCGN